MSRTNSFFRLLAAAACLSAFWSVNGCDGGIVGTGTGPIDRGPVVIPSEPKLRLPLSIVDLAGLGPGQGQDPMTITSQPSSGAKAWQLISSPLTMAVNTRIQVQEILALITPSYSQLIADCESRRVNGSCSVEPGDLRGEYSPEVTSLMVSLYRDYLGQADQQPVGDQRSMDAVIQHYSALQGQSVLFDSVVLTQPVDDSFYPLLNLSTPSLLDGRVLSIQWNKNSTQLAYTVADTNGGQLTDRYVFQRKTNGQRLTLQRWPVSGNLTEEFFFEAIDDASNDSDALLYSAKVTDNVITGQANDTNAFSSTVNTTPTVYSILEEDFSPGGIPGGFESCTVVGTGRTDEPFCVEGPVSVVTDVELYLTEPEFQNSTRALGYPRYTVTGLPASVQRFEVVQAGALAPFEPSDSFCVGWQSQFGRITLFCFNEDFLANNTDIVAMNLNGSSEIIAGAELVLED